jgi:hypothetical protein
MVFRVGRFLSLALPPAAGCCSAVYLPRSIGAKAQTAAEAFAPNAFVRIKPDDTITLVMPQVEMGQGTYTSMSMLVAEELEVDLAKVGPRGGAAERQAVCQSLARVPGHRRLDIGDGILGASTARRRDCSRHVDPSGGLSMECRSCLVQG